jgi:hypothetical protein
LCGKTVQSARLDNRAEEQDGSGHGPGDSAFEQSVRLSFDVARALPNAGPDSFLFSFHKVGLAGHSHLPVLYDADLRRPMGSWRNAWQSSRFCRRQGTKLSTAK